MKYLQGNVQPEGSFKQVALSSFQMREMSSSDETAVSKLQSLSANISLASLRRLIFRQNFISLHKTENLSNKQSSLHAVNNSGCFFRLTPRSVVEILSERAELRFSLIAQQITIFYVKPQSFELVYVSRTKNETANEREKELQTEERKCVIGEEEEEKKNFCCFVGNLFRQQRKKEMQT